MILFCKGTAVNAIKKLHNWVSCFARNSSLKKNHLITWGAKTNWNANIFRDNLRLKIKPRLKLKMMSFISKSQKVVVEGLRLSLIISYYFRLKFISKSRKSPSDSERLDYFYSGPAQLTTDPCSSCFFSLATISLYRLSGRKLIRTEDRSCFADLFALFKRWSFGKRIVLRQSFIRESHKQNKILFAEIMKRDHVHNQQQGQ